MALGPEVSVQMSKDVFGFLCWKAGSHFGSLELLSYLYFCTRLVGLTLKTGEDEKKVLSFAL